MSEGNGGKPPADSADETILVHNSEQCVVDLHQRIQHTLKCIESEEDFDLATLLVQNQLVIMKALESMHGQSPEVQAKAIRAPRIVPPDFMRSH